MGFCKMCGISMGLLRGKSILNGHEYCGVCYNKALLEDNKNRFNLYRRKYYVPITCPKVCYEKGIIEMQYGFYDVWLRDMKLNFFPSEIKSNEEDYVLLQIPLSQIEYYERKAETIAETKISGGGGTTGGTSIIGAIIGAAIAGAPGAIIGSRKEGKIQPIKSELVTTTNRFTFMNVFIDNIKHSLLFRYDDYDIFLKLILDKAYTNLQNTDSSHQSDHLNQSKVIGLIKELAELKDNDIITEQEFQEKKRILLDKIY